MGKRIMIVGLARVIIIVAVCGITSLGCASHKQELTSETKERKEEASPALKIGHCESRDPREIRFQLTLPGYYSYNVRSFDLADFRILGDVGAYSLESVSIGPMKGGLYIAGRANVANAKGREFRVQFKCDLWLVAAIGPDRHGSYSVALKFTWTDEAAAWTIDKERDVQIVPE